MTDKMSQWIKVMLDKLPQSETEGWMRKSQNLIGGITGPWIITRVVPCSHALWDRKRRKSKGCTTAYGFELCMGRWTCHKFQELLQKVISRCYRNPGVWFLSLAGWCSAYQIHILVSLSGNVVVVLEQVETVHRWLLEFFSIQYKFSVRLIIQIYT